MLSYFLANLGAEKTELIRSGGIEFYDLQINGKHGIIIDQALIRKALELANLEAGNQYPTEYEGISHLILIDPAERDKPKVTVENSYGGTLSGKIVTMTTDMLLPIVGKSVIVHFKESGISRIRTDGNFHIFIWSSPSMPPMYTMAPENIWGHRVSHRGSAFPPSEKGIAIKDGDYAVAELIDDNLFVHHQLFAGEMERELEIYKRLLEETIAELTLSPEKKSERIRAMAQKQLENEREKYIAECSKSLAEDFSYLERESQNLGAAMKEFQKSLGQNIRYYKEKESRISDLNGTSRDSAEKYGLEFDKLLSAGKIINIKVSRGKIDVFTDTLFCKDPRTGRLHEIGKFQIEINTDGKADPRNTGKFSGIRWINLTRKVDGHIRSMEAPHVFPGGIACLGSAQDYLPELIRNYEFAAAAAVAIQFIESVNIDDSAGKSIDHWPEAKKDSEGNPQPSSAESYVGGGVTADQFHHGISSEKFREITEEILLPVIGRNIHISMPHGETKHPYNDEMFHIFIWSSLSLSGQLKHLTPPSRIWGYPVDCKDDAFDFSGKGIAIRDSDYTVAELVDNNLFIHHDIAHKGTENERNIYRKLLEEVAKEISANPSFEKGATPEEARKKEREKYIAECSQRLKLDVAGLKQEMPEIAQRIESFQQKIVNSTVELRKAEAKMGSLGESLKLLQEKNAQEFEKLVAMEKILEVKTLPGKIQLYTDDIFCSDPETGKIHRIGKFLIEIHLNGRSGGVIWSNLTKRISDPQSAVTMEAPQIKQGGRNFTGNVAEYIPELIANLELSAVAELAIQFIESVSPETPAAELIKYWPEVETKNEQKEEKEKEEEYVF